MLKRHILIERTLRDAQNDVEACRVSETVKRRQRALLRGFRAGYAASLERLSMEDVERALRQELEFPAQTECAVPGTDDEV